MKISIFGLGYVGVVSAACLAKDGHEVIGVDLNPDKVTMVNQGESPIVEPGLTELIQHGVREQRITATTSAEEAVLSTDISLISVGTPPKVDGEPDLSFVYGVCREIAAAVRRKAQAHVVVLRSTVPPGTLHRCEAIMREEAGSVPLYVAFNPEFLREGAAIHDYYAPAYTIIGTEQPEAEKALRDVYATIDAPVYTVSPTVAEMVKYVANTWHATKIVFANEVGRVSKAFGVDGREVMDLIVKDTKLNASSAYLRPGFAYGGSCLPKDLGAMLHYAKSMGVPVPFLNAVTASNTQQIELALQAVLRTGVRRVTVLGLAFKSGTDDLRESPAVPLVKRLLGEGCTVRIYDPSVNHARLMGTNLAYIRHNLPHFESLLLEDGASAMVDTEMLVLTYGTAEFRQLVANAPSGIHVLDLAGVLATKPEGKKYDALGW